VRGDLELGEAVPSAIGFACWPATNHGPPVVAAECTEGNVVEHLVNLGCGTGYRGARHGHALPVVAILLRRVLTVALDDGAPWLR